MTPLGYLKIAAALVAMLGAGFGGWEMRAGHDAATVAAATRQLTDLKLADQKATIAAVNGAIADFNRRAKKIHDADVAAAFDRGKIEGNTQYILQRIPVYVSAKADAGCILPNGFIKLLDAAGLGIKHPDDLPGAADEPNDAPSGISLSEASALLATNLGNAAENLAQLKNAIAVAPALQPADNTGAKTP